MKMDEESIYWLFSSSAQSISAFIAFLVTGFALVLAMMEAAQSKDETLQDIHDQLKISYYKKIKFLAVLTATAVLSSLIMIYLNGTNASNKDFFMC